jgi:Ca2+-binding EF-hand superfamily protein
MNRENGEKGETSKDYRKAVKEIFNSFDRDGNGIISQVEFASGLSMLGAEVNDADANLVYGFCDVNGDGEMDFDDFMGLIDQVGWWSRETDQDTSSVLVGIKVLCSTLISF